MQILRWSLSLVLLGVLITGARPALAVEQSAPPCETAAECYGAALEAGMAESFGEARGLFRRALDLDPLFYEAGAMLRLTAAVIEGKAEPQGAAHACRGAMYFETGRFEEALREFSAAVSRDSQSAVSHYFRGLAWAAARRDSAKAVASLSKAIELDPRHEMPYAARGQWLAAQKDMPRALLDFDRSLAINPKYLPALIGRGDVLLEKGDLTGARTSYDAALAVDGRSVQALLGRAAACSAGREPAKALADLDAILRIDPKHETALLERARVCADLPDMEGAFKAASAAISLTESARAYKVRAALYRKAGDHRKAIEDLDRALKKDAKDGAAHRSLGESLAALGQDASALAECETALKLDRNDEKALFLRAALRMQDRKLKEAREDLSRAVTIDSRFGEAYSARAAVDYVLEDYQGAANDAKKAAELLPREERPHLLLGRALLKLGQDLQASEALKKATSLEPTDPLAHFYLGLAYEGLSQFGLAAASFRQTLRFNPKDSVACLRLGDVHLKTNALTEALEAYRRAVEIKADQFEAYRGMAAVSRKMGRVAEAAGFEETADRIERERLLRPSKPPKPEAAAAAK